ncbi:MAG: hypothetical protein RL591_2169, partial [Planctomycetota bacterium]
MSATVSTIASIALTELIPDPALVGGAFVATLVGTFV